MGWDELQEKHKKEFEDFFAERDRRFQEMQARHDELFQAFQDLGHEVPLNIKERMREDRDAWEKEWGNEGRRLTELKEAQKKETEDRKKIETFKLDLEQREERDKDGQQGMEF